jgi:type I restriction enzyme, S subunit
MDASSFMEGELPEDWRIARLDEVVQPSRPLRGSITGTDSRIPFIPMALLPNDGLPTRRWEMRSPEEVRSGVPFTEGDVLLAKITPCLENGKLGIACGIPGGWGMTSTEVYPLRAERVATEFLAYFLTLPSVRHGLASKMQGATGRQRLPKEALDAYPIPVPPLPEQRAIAGVLRTVQGAKEACERVLAATRQLKQSLLQHLFTYGSVPFPKAAHVPLKETEVDPIPEHWGTIRLGDTASIGNGSTLKRTEPRYWDGGAIPWLTSAKVHDRTIRHADEFVTKAAREECHLPMVSRGSLVIAITGQGKTLGNAAKLELEACVSQHLAYMTFHDTRLLPEFVLAFLRLRYAELQAISRGGGSTKGALTCGFLKGFEVPLPPLAEQLEIAAQLSAVDAKLAAEESRRAALEALFQSLLHSLMTGQVRLPEFAKARL